MLGGGRCDVEVVRPQSCTKCMQLLGEHYCITFQLHMQRKDESLKACRFWAPAKCTPTGSQKFHSGGGGAPKPGAPPKKRLQVLPTARWRALDMGSVAAAAILLFFVQVKTISLCT